MANPVLTFGEIKPHLISSLMSKFNLELRIVDHNNSIPGSFWGESEAGLVDNKLYVRLDTPVHSLLHEGCHYICMDESRRSGLDTDAGGDYDEENAVCYLQIILADHINAMGKQRMFEDMDSWGYTFRLGSAEQWFNLDADDAKQWLLNYSLLDQASNPTYELRS
ncbi:MAG: hypothetical protein V3U78_06090 [Thiotrichaceae bacterium]